MNAQCKCLQSTRLVNLTDEVRDYTAIGKSSVGAMKEGFSIWPGCCWVFFYGDIREVLIVARIIQRVSKHKQGLILYLIIVCCWFIVEPVMTIKKVANWVQKAYQNIKKVAKARHNTPNYMTWYLSNFIGAVSSKPSNIIDTQLKNVVCDN